MPSMLCWIMKFWINIADVMEGSVIVRCCNWTFLASNNGNHQQRCIAASSTVFSAASLGQVKLILPSATFFSWRNCQDGGIDGIERRDPDAL